MPHISKEKETIDGVENGVEKKSETETAITKIDLESYTQAPSAAVSLLPKLSRQWKILDWS